MGTRNGLGLTALAAGTWVGALPFIAVGVLALTRGGSALLPAFFILVAAAAALGTPPIRPRGEGRVDPSAIPALVAALLLPMGIASIVGAVGPISRVVSGRERAGGIHLMGAAALSAGLASAAHAAGMLRLGGDLGPVLSALAATGVYVAADLLQTRLREIVDRAATPPLVAQLLGPAPLARIVIILGTAFVVTAVGIDPLLAVLGIPLFAFGHLATRFRVIEARRSRLLATAVEVAHSVGTTLDVDEVFRNVYREVRAVLPADAFFVATADPTRTKLSYRYLVDDDRELEPTERDLAGTIAGVCITRAEPILMRNAEVETSRYGIERAAWGTVHERSVLVAPLRHRGDVVGAISAQSVLIDAYDRDDLELIVDIANEASIAIERAELHERQARLSKRLFELHRVGIELAAHRDITSLCNGLATAVSSLIGGRSGVYLYSGGTELVRGDTPLQEDQWSMPTIPVSEGTATDRALREGQPVEITSLEELPAQSRRLIEERGLQAVLVHPLRAGGRSIGVLYVAWQEAHTFTNEERELVGVIAGVGATALRSLRSYEELEDAYLSTITTLTATIQAREGYREDHLRRTAADAVALGQRIGLDGQQLRALKYAALFHSLGKISVPAAVLSKSTALAPEERRLVEEHPVLGAQILGSIRFLEDVVPIVRHANERWDGKGYPNGLRAEAIPRVARVLHIAIAYQAMIVDRPYRAALSQAEALVQLREGSGTRYDPGLVDEFARMIEGRGAIKEAEQAISGARELSILSEITPHFHALLDAQQLIERVLAILESRLPGTRLSIMLEDPATGDLVRRATAGNWSERSVKRIPKGRGIAGWVAQHGTPQLVDDVRLDPRFIKTGDDSRSALVVPLVSSGRAIGILGLLHPSVGAFSQRDVTLMQAVGAQLAAAIEVAGLHEQLKVAANTDGLTGIHNYRYFWDRLEEEIARTERRKGGALSIAYFDIDGLKAVNDRYGHLGGDAVLRTLGAVIGSHVRAEDVPARYGGDEFAIVMPETPRDEAESVVKRLMDVIDRTKVDLDDGTVVTMPTRSWGVATFPDDGRTAKGLVEAADTRAYSVKRRK